MEFVVSYDLRAPAFGTPAREIYAATLDQCEWADSIGFDAICSVCHIIFTVLL